MEEVAMSPDVRELILWAREQRIQIARIKVGDVELELVDLELLGGGAQATQAKDEKDDGWKKHPPESPADLYAELARQRGLNVDPRELVEVEELS